jgi:hypothetical protein
MFSGFERGKILPVAVDEDAYIGHHGLDLFQGHAYGLRAQQ